jgi:D-alanyl-D-alanine carboxypeptidase (penicillin-binding protein 5/6)
MTQIIQIHSKDYFLIFILIFTALGGIFFHVENSRLNNDFKNNEIRLAKIGSLLKDEPILAKSYSIYDMTRGQKIYGKNDNVPMPLASLVKTMAIVVVLNNNKQDREVVISKNAIRQTGDFGIFVDEKWNLYDLIKLTLISSANDGIYAMVENNNEYLEKMNEKAKKIGMENSRFLNFTGLDVDEKRAGAFASAENANILAMYGLRAYPAFFSVTTLPEVNLQSKSGFVHNVKNTNVVLDKIPNVLFSKTGYTELAGGNLSVIFKDKMGHDMAITVLGSTFDGRFSDMEKLVNILQLSYESTI